MSKLKVLDLFSGIGGFSLGLERTGGFETVAFCEIEPFPQKVLKKHWPEVPIYEDVRELTSAKLAADGITEIDIITGGFPCQDISVAGKQAGINENTRSGLWSECLRLVSKIRPRYALFENVSNLLSGPAEQKGAWFSQVLADLAKCGYDAEWRDIPAWTMGLPHARARVWIVAYPQQNRWTGILPCFLSKHEAQSFGASQATIALAASRSLDSRARGDSNGESPFLTGNDGLSNQLDELGASGNAVVPAIPEMIGNAILAAESDAI